MKKLFLKMASVLAALSIVLVLMPQTVNAASNGTADFVTRFYQLCLSRDPDPAGLKNWVDQLQSGKQTGANVAYGFVFSPEFQNRNVTDDEYINIMYHAFFNRDADAGGYNNWATYLEAGFTRHYVLAGFVNSQEFKNLCASYNINPGSLAILQKDSSIGDLLGGSGFEVDGPDYFGLYWFATNTSGKEIKELLVTYYFYDNQGNP